MAVNVNTLLTDLLKQTSRSFYLTLRVLPGAIRPQIGLAYLLARTTDTIADTGIVPLAQRLDALQKLRERILGQNAAPLNFGELARHQALPAEQALLEKVEDSLAQLQMLSPADLKLVREVLTIITSGQELDLRRFAGASAEKIIALETEAELEDYTYRVAGCVGGFWTKICRAHLFPQVKLDDELLMANGIRFGKGLQLVNILRDLPADLRNGRCYLPADKLVEAGLQPADLLSPANEAKFLPLFRECLNKAESHLAAGWAYTNSLPFGQVRVRLACAWPILIGIRTIGQLRAASMLELQQGIKISRNEVRCILLWSAFSYPFPGLWRKLFSGTGKAVASAQGLV
ncbi:MAG: phytoene/squalene synthase family protein [Verrucomicrobiota bacterium]|jgi:farnesyl-diphosphate farnesyltransferase